MLGWVNLHELCVEVEAALGPFGGMEGVPKGSRWVGFLVSNICSAPLPSPVSASAGSGTMVFLKPIRIVPGFSSDCAHLHS